MTSDTATSSVRFMSILRPTLIFILWAASTILLAGCDNTQQSSEPATVTEPNRLTIDRLYASPSLNGPSPRGVKFSPDGRRVTFLRSRETDQSRFDLWQFDVASGEPSMLVDSTLLEPEVVELSEAEKALRERKRIAGSKGIVEYDWGTADTLLVPLGGDLHLVTLTSSGPETRQLTDTEVFEYDARVSPGGRYVSFIRDGALYAIDLATQSEMQISPGADPQNAISYGVAEFVAQEEMRRYTGYWWSPGDRFLAYTRVDESTVDIIPRFDIAAEAVTVVEQRYPRAGRPNAVVDLFIHDMQTGEVAEFLWRKEEWGPATDQYLARVIWGALEGDRHGLLALTIDRDQTQIRSVGWRSEQGGLSDPRIEPREVVLETQETWVNLSDDLQFSDLGAIMTTETTGFRHISIAGPRDPAPRIVTSGDWAVDEIVGVDQAAEIIYFTGFRDTPLERHLYSVAISGGEPSRITEPGATWTISMAPDAKSYVGTASRPDHPPQTGLYASDGSRIAWLEENALDERHPYFPYLSSHTMPEFGTLKAEDGQTLYYSIQKPPGFDPSKRYPVIVEVYGGPHVQTVTRNWERLTDQYYTHEGYIIFRLDNRGSSNRGKAFEDVIYRRTGGPEVADQLVGVNWLKTQAFVDPDRIAIQGWSYGGYMTLMTLLQAPQGTFAAAVSGAPVTDWSLYDTFYTERYMDTPQDNPDGYEASSVFPYVDALDTPLLLIHGMADDNVTFDNTTRLMADLQQRGKVFELMTYPGQRHGIRGEALQKHLMQTRMAFLNRHLKEE